eukprot:5052447-Prymnesium_polylepis.1
MAFRSPQLTGTGWRGVGIGVGRIRKASHLVGGGNPTWQATILSPRQFCHPLAARRVRRDLRRLAVRPPRLLDRLLVARRRRARLNTTARGVEGGSGAGARAGGAGARAGGAGIRASGAGRTLAAELRRLERLDDLLELRVVGVGHGQLDEHLERGLGLALLVHPLEQQPRELVVGLRVVDHVCRDPQVVEVALAQLRDDAVDRTDHLALDIL